MKRIILFITSLYLGGLLHGNLNAQTVLINENFDNYIVEGKFIEQTILAGDTNWYTDDDNPGGDKDPIVSNINSSSPNNSLHFSNEENIHLDIGLKISGVYEIKYKMWITSDTTLAFFNIRSQKKQGLSNGTFGLELYYHSFGIDIVAGGESANYAYGDNLFNQWVNFEYIINLNSDLVTIKVNNTSVGEFQWSNGSGNNPYSIKSLEALNFYAAEIGEPYITDFYIDDIIITELIAPSTAHLDPSLIEFTLDGDNSSDQANLTISNNGESDLHYTLTKEYITSLPSQEPFNEQLLSYDQGGFYQKVGLLGEGSNTYEFAVMFPSEMVQEHIGMQFSKLELYIGDIIEQFKLKVYSEGTHHNIPGDLIYEQIFTPTLFDAMNIIPLDNGPIINGQGLWVSIEITQNEPSAPIGIDQPESANENGQWIKIDGKWYTFWNLDNWSENFIIRAKLEGNTAIQWLSLDQNTGIIEPNSSETISVEVNNQGQEIGPHQVQLKLSSNDSDYPEFKYIPVNLEFTTNIEEYFSDIISSVKVFPNPTKSVINVSSDQIITKFKIFNLKGKLLEEQTFNQTNKIKINTNSYKSGTYFIEISSDGKELIRKKIVIQK